LIAGSSGLEGEEISEEFKAEVKALLDMNAKTRHQPIEIPHLFRHAAVPAEQRGPARLTPSWRIFYWAIATNVTHFSEPISVRASPFPAD
jgi:hypothetical protein